ncbi:hypothetical protein M404DRAFT_437062 [Pisolithus tinctorius Marx 270]|uniref:Uncharacterized protein n=1 Tax=Pisolithus tinctorius Marx 270 TaxID=870435 RepID=A0A0C3KAE8_PISTI|nr:hypothetical protein M404DRAFT_437062 [Pisolithus tinctorius Marx 270]
MALLGWQYNATALNPAPGSTSSSTLSDLETAVGNVASAAAWAGESIIDAPRLFSRRLDFHCKVLTTSGYYTESIGNSSVVQSAFKLRLNINLTQVSIGLFTSVALLALSSFLIHSPRVNNEHDVDSCGILQVMWLSSRHDAIRNEVAAAKSSSVDLRQAGFRCTTAFGAEGAEDEVRPAKGSNTC